MTLHKRPSILFLGPIAALLALATGIYALFATISRPTTAELYLAAVACGIYCIATIVDILTCTNIEVRKLSVWVLGGVTIVPSVLTGAVLGILTLAQDRSSIGTRFCGRRAEQCGWAGNRALLTLYMLWFASSVVQVTYCVLYSTGKSVAETPMRQVNIDHVPSPITSPTPTEVLRTTTTRRVPLMRQVTSDEPFSYEEALQAKAATATPATHHTTLSSSSHPSNATFVQSHISQVSYSRSWASTLPTAVSGASPRSIFSKKYNYSDDASARHIDKSPAEKHDWSGWGIAVSSPQHKNRLENMSRSTACSRTSSRPSHTARSPSSIKFHLPSSPELRAGFTSPSPRMIDAEVQPRPGIISMNSCSTASDKTSQYDSPPASPARPRQRMPSFAIDARLSLFPNTTTGSKNAIKHTRTNSSTSPERKRASILGSIKPRLPDARAFRRSSWIPTSKSTQTSPSKSWSSADDMFASWDTSTVEKDLVLAPASRDCTPRVMPLPTPADERDEESLWGHGNIRVASDGSVFTRAPDDATIQKLSSRVQTD